MQVIRELLFAPDCPVTSVAPLRLAIPRRSTDLPVRVTYPADGRSRVPVILFSHGSMQSLYTYAPLADHWAAQGFAVVQPSHADSWMFGAAMGSPAAANFWRNRENELADVLDHLGQVEEMVPALRGRIDYDHIAVAGHSWGAQTASMLLGATHPDPNDGAIVRGMDRRIGAGILLCVPGHGGDDLSDLAREHFPFMNPDFSGMTTPTLVVAGGADVSPLSVRGVDWWRDAYDHAPGARGMLTLFGAEHSLGGIHSYESEGCADYSRARVAAIQRISAAFLLSLLNINAVSWQDAGEKLGQEFASIAHLEIK